MEQSGSSTSDLSDNGLAPTSKYNSPQTEAMRCREEKKHGCTHYRRRCKLVAPCCDEVFWCRHCHNQVKNDNEQDVTKRHQLDRRAVSEVVCALCELRQPATSTCTGCGVQFGKYSCMVCHFYDDDISKKQFHCDECGICRVGGREKFFHCSTCSCCYAVELQDGHVCIEKSMHQNCPVCFEFLFDSVRNINVMTCGHTIHQDCLKLLFDHATYNCPICSRSTAKMDRVWIDMDQRVASTPMPPEYRNIKVDILCNDCNSRCKVNFHVIGHKCSSTTCGSYNTRRI